MDEREDEAATRLIAQLKACIEHQGARTERSRMAANMLLSLYGVESPQPRLESPLLVALTEMEDGETPLEVAIVEAEFAMREGMFLVAELWLRQALRLAPDEADPEPVVWILEHWVHVLDELAWEREMSTEALQAVSAVDPNCIHEPLQVLLLGILNRDGRYEATVAIGQRLLAEGCLPIADYRVADALRALGRPVEAAYHRRRCWETERDEAGLAASDTLETACALVDDLRAAGHDSNAEEVLDASLSAAERATDTDEDRAQWVGRLRAMVVA